MKTHPDEGMTRCRFEGENRALEVNSRNQNNACTIVFLLFDARLFLFRPLTELRVDGYRDKHHQSWLQRGVYQLHTGPN